MPVHIGNPLRTQPALPRKNVIRVRPAPAIIIPKVSLPTIQPKFAPVPKIGNRPQATGHRAENRSQVARHGVAPVLLKTGAAAQVGDRPSTAGRDLRQATHGKPGPSTGNMAENKLQVARHGVAPVALKTAAAAQIGPNDPVAQMKAGSGQPRFYPNLNPAAAALKADPGEFMRLEGSFDSSYYRMRRGGDHGLLVPNSKFIFVRTMDGETVMHQRYRHPVLAQGRPVLYAGEASFNNGKLDWWSNGSGNYRPDSDHADQAALPMERFFTYEQVLKGTNREGRSKT